MPWRRPYRLWRHLFADARGVRSAFADAALSQIQALIATGEREHRGQVRFAVEAALPPARVLRKLSPRERALEVFGLARVWDTEENCGVLVYLLLADRDVEIVADRGIHARVGDAAWETVCRTMEEGLREGRYLEAAKAGIAEINALLAQHFPRDAAPGRNELPDQPIVL